jgi:hypothetical protein
VRFRGCDLVRNLLLSVYVARPLADQEALLRTRWLEPIELRCAGAAGLDALIHAFLEVEAAAGGAWVACELERRVGRLEVLSGETAGVALYARFVSRVAALEAANACSNGNDGSARVPTAVNDMGALHSSAGGMAALAVAADGSTLTLAPTLQPNMETPALVRACETVLHRLACFAATNA